MLNRQSSTITFTMIRGESHCVCKLCGGGVLTHFNDVGPVRLTINENKELLAGHVMQSLQLSVRTWNGRSSVCLAIIGSLPFEVGGFGSGGILGQIFYVLVHARPVDSEADSCLGPDNPLVCIMKTTEHGRMKALGDKQAAAVSDHRQHLYGL